MATSSRQRRVVIAIVLTTIGLTGILIAQGSTQIAAGALLPLDPSAFSPEPLGNVQPTPQENVNVEPLLCRNIFDSETGCIPRVDPEPEDGGGEEIEAPPPPTYECGQGEPPPNGCDGSMRLVGAFVRYRNPEDSFAAITDASGTALLYQAGMSVDSREILCIEHNLVVLQGSGGACSLSMFSQQERIATAQPERPAAVVRPREANTGDVDSSELENGITRVSDNEFSIERSLVDSLLQDQAALMRTARVIPHEEGGRVVGVKLYGIRRSSLLGRLGIQNGDMLRTINGYDMTAPDSALEAYARLRSADRITVNLNRRGSDQTIDYQIR